MASLLTVVSSDSLQLLPTPERQALEELVDDLLSKNKSLETRADICVAESAQQVFDLEAIVKGFTEKEAHTAEANETLKKQLHELEKDKDERFSKMLRLQSDLDRAVADRDSFKRSKSGLEEDKEHLAEMVGRRNDEVQSYQDEIGRLTSSLKESQANCAALRLRLEEEESTNRTSDHREKRWNSERELLEQEAAWLKEELAKRDQDLLSARRETSTKEMELRSSMDAKCDRIRQLEVEIEGLKVVKTNITNQVTELSTKLKDAIESKAAAEDKFEQEIAVRAQLTATYRSAREDAESRVAELTGAFDQMKGLYEEAKETHFSLQAQLETMKEEADALLQEKEHAIADLRDELAKANDLLQSKNRIHMTEEELAVISPGAAAAVKLMKGGNSLTQLYRNHCDVVEQLEKQKSENRKIEMYFQKLMEDLKDQAPQMKRLKDDFDEERRVVNALRSQLGQLEEEQKKLIDERDRYMRQSLYSKGELNRYERENEDLSAQVRELLRCVELSRQYGFGEITSTSENGAAGDELVVFRNIKELQEKNQQLLSALHEARARPQLQAKEAQEQELAEMRQRIQAAMEEVESLRFHRDKQQTVIDTLTDQRESYKSQLEESRQAVLESSVSSRKSDRFPQPNFDDSMPADSTAVERSQAMDVLNKEFEVYRKEKAENERMLNEKVASLQSVITELRSNNAKLNGEIQYQEERFKVLQSNVEMYKKEISQLQEKNERTAITLAKHEQSVVGLSADLTVAREECSRLRSSYDQLTAKLHLVQATERRLQAENTRLQRDSERQEQLISALQGLQSSIQAKDSATAVNMRSELETLRREEVKNKTLVMKLTEQHQLHINDFKDKLSEATRGTAVQAARIRELETELQWTKQRLGEANSQLKTLEDVTPKEAISPSASMDKLHKESAQYQSRLSYLDMSLKETNERVVDLTEQLNRSRAECNQLKNLSESVEGSLVAQKEHDQAEFSELQNQLAEIVTHMEEFKKKYDDLEKQYKEAEAELETRRAKDHEVESKAAGRIKSLEQSLAETEQSLQDAQNRENELRGDLEQQASRRKEVETRLLNALSTAATSGEQLAQVKDNLLSTKQQVTQLESELSAAKYALSSAQLTIKEKESSLEQEASALQKKCEELQKRNDELCGQIEQLGDQVTNLERLNRGEVSAAIGGEAKSLSGEDDLSNASMESLIDVIKYLRGEKRQAQDKVGTLETEKKAETLRTETLDKELTAVRTELSDAKVQAELAEQLQSERAELLARLSEMQTLKESYTNLRKDFEVISTTLEGARERLSSTETTLADEKRNREAAECRASDLDSQLTDTQTERETWRARHEELVAVRAQFDPEQLQAVRNDLVACQKQLEESGAIAKELRAVKLTLQKKNTELFNLNKDLEDRIKEANSSTASVNQKLDDNQKMLLQVRKLAKKYKNQADGLVKVKAELEEKLQQAPPPEAAAPAGQAELATSAAVSDISAEIAKIAEEKQQLTARVEELTGQLESSNAELTVFKSQKEASDMSQNLALNEERTKVEAEGKRLNEEKAELKHQVEQLSAEREESALRLQSLSSFHKNLTNQVNTLKVEVEELRSTNETLTAQNQSLQKLLAESQKAARKALRTTEGTPGKGISLKRPGIQPPTASIRPIDTEPHQRVVSVKPLSQQQRTTATVTPTTLAPSSVIISVDQRPQSPPAQASISPMVVSTTNTTHYSLSAGTSSQLPQAVVQPHVEPQDTVSASSDSVNGATISSSSQPVMADSLPSASSDVSGSSEAVSRKRVVQSEAMSMPKRIRTGSPSEQVSTSEQLVHIPTLADEDINQEQQQVVGSSSQPQDDDDDEIIFVESVDVCGDNVPESSGQGMSGLMPSASSYSGFEDQNRGRSVEVSNVPLSPFAFTASASNVSVAQPMVQGLQAGVFGEQYEEGNEAEIFEEDRGMEAEVEADIYGGFVEPPDFGVSDLEDGVHREVASSSVPASDDLWDEAVQGEEDVVSDEDGDSQSDQDELSSEAQPAVVSEESREADDAPTTSEPLQQPVKLRKPIVWDKGEASSSSQPGASSLRGRRGRFMKK